MEKKVVDHALNLLTLINPSSVTVYIKHIYLIILYFVEGFFLLQNGFLKEVLKLMAINKTFNLKTPKTHTATGINIKGHGQ